MLSLLWCCTWRNRWLSASRAHQWVFVTGCNRSGKTSLANLLRNHPQVTAVPNGNSHTRALPSSESEGCPHIWTERLSRFRLTELDDKGPAARLMFDWLHFSRHPRKVIVVESDLAAVQMRWLQEVFEDSYFIGVVRNGFAVAQGIRLKEGYAIDRCAAQWNLANRILLEDAKFIRNFRLVRYEELVSRTITVTQDIAKFLGIDAAPLLPFARNGWRLGNTDSYASTLRDANPDLIKQLTPNEIHAVAANAREMLERLGFATPE